MKNLPILLSAFATILFACPMPGRSGTPELQNPEVRMSFIILGDIHYCEERFYDMGAMFADKPGDWRQIARTYAPVTKANWKDQASIISAVARSTEPPVRCIVQLGDISEGLGNTPGGPEAIARNITDILKDTDPGCPWLLVKGNHDITGVGDSCKIEAKAAFGKFYTPFIREQTGQEGIREATCAYETGGVLFVVLDAFGHVSEQISFAKQALESSNARYKFICLHEPVIPATERCWHFLRHNRPEIRESFLRIVAENQAFVLCGHLHRYSVLRRKTPWGPIVQVMANSVTNLKREADTSETLDGVQYYGTYLCDTYRPDFNPDNLETRRAQLSAEAPFVDYYKMNTLAGYGVITIDSATDQVLLKYYAAFDPEKPYDVVDLTELYRRP